MTKLQKLYSTIQNLKELGLELGNDLLKQTSELEQEIIKKEMLGDYYKALNSLEFIANQFSSNLFEGVTFFDFPTILSDLTLEKIEHHADHFIAEMISTDFSMMPKI